MKKNMRNWLVMASVVPTMGLSQVTLAQEDEVEASVRDFVTSNAAVVQAAMAEAMREPMNNGMMGMPSDGEVGSMGSDSPIPGMLPLMNPGFETGGLHPWSVYVPKGGSAEVVTSHPCTPPYAPMGGEYFLELKTDGPGSYTTAAQFIYLKKGETIGGWAAFDSPDYLPYKDRAKVAIYFLENGSATTYLPWEREVDGNAGDNQCGPWEEWGFEAEKSGLYALTYRITNAKDSVVDSYALFDMGECAGKMCDLAYMGTNSADIIIGSQKADVICGLGGDDEIFGMGGNDLICGGAGDDELHGQKGKDIIYGGLGNDEIYGGKQNDEAHGEDGNDELYGGKGWDNIYGGYVGMNGGVATDDPDQVVEVQSDELYGGKGHDHLEGDGGSAGDAGIQIEDDVIDGGKHNDECSEDGDDMSNCEIVMAP